MAPAPLPSPPPSRTATQTTSTLSPTTSRDGQLKTAPEGDPTDVNKASAGARQVEPHEKPKKGGPRVWRWTKVVLGFLLDQWFIIGIGFFIGMAYVLRSYLDRPLSPLEKSSLTFFSQKQRGLPERRSFWRYPRSVCFLLLSLHQSTRCTLLSPSLLSPSLSEFPATIAHLPFSRRQWSIKLLAVAIIFFISGLTLPLRNLVRFLLPLFLVPFASFPFSSSLPHPSCSSMFYCTVHRCF
jgi:hypothetical protein